MRLSVPVNLWHLQMAPDARRNFMQEFEATEALDLILDRAVRIAAVRGGLEQALEELDQLELWQAGAHLSMAVHALGDAC
jgi:hypothetical protein